MRRLFVLILALGFPFFAFTQKSVSPIVESMLIFPGQEKHVHGSSMVALPNGDLLSVWFYGNGERNSDDVKLMGARLQKAPKPGANPF